eukprot:m.264952 g.264952  ORF g.264952 m.264952 type:complete len:456 (+) comp26734_c0_seq2:4937-6304(+)
MVYWTCTRSHPFTKCNMMLLKALAPAALFAVVAANDNGLAITPPLGWRSWNLYGGNVDQGLIEGIMDGMVNNSRKIWNGETMNLKQLGYGDVGLDDNWQACDAPAAKAAGMRYHDIEGNPIVNLDRFPDFNTMTSHAHGLGLTSGWYGNNCICSDHCKNATSCTDQIKGDVAALVKFNFDSWKLDGCGGETDLVQVDAVLRAAGKKVMVENCHWGSKKPFKPDPTLPPAEGCPWNFYRSSGDVRASYASIMYNLGTVFPLAKDGLSYPGCWAYPDMLQVGCQHGPGGASDPGLTQEEARTHFGAWAVVSSPLTLSHDVNNASITDRIWDIISNTEILDVNQAYAGFSGGSFAASEETVALTDAFIESTESEDRVTAPLSQYLYKPLPGGKIAIVLLNAGLASADLEVKFSDIPGVKGNTFTVRDLWLHKDLGSSTESFTAQSVASHDCAFLVLSP